MKSVEATEGTFEEETAIFVFLEYYLWGEEYVPTGGRKICERPMASLTIFSLSLGFCHLNIICLGVFSCRFIFVFGIYAT